MKTFEVDTVRVVEEVEYWERYLDETNIHLPLESRLRNLFEIVTDHEYETERVGNERYIVQLEKEIEKLEAKIDRMKVWAKRLITASDEDLEDFLFVPTANLLHKEIPHNETE